MQYFERAVFEQHPENAGTPYEVLLTQLGTLRYHAPLPNKSLYSITMVSPTEGWAVGDKGVILHYNRGRWQQAISPVQNGYLLSISMGSADDGWAVGTDNALHYKNGHWQPAPESFPPLSNGTPFPYQHGFEAVEMISPTEGWAAADHGIILHYGNGFWSRDYGYASGRSTGSLVIAIKMISTNEGWAIGNDDLLHYVNGYWSPAYALDNVDGRRVVPHSLSAVSNSDIWAVGIQGVILHYDGKQWGLVSGPTNADLNNVYMVSAADGWAVGSNVRNGGGGVILHYDGSAWQQVPNPTDKYLAAVQMVSPTEGWAVGEAGTILHYQNGTWSVYQQ